MRPCDGNCDEMPVCDCSKCRSGLDEEYGKCRKCQKETDLRNVGGGMLCRTCEFERFARPCRQCQALSLGLPCSQLCPNCERAKELAQRPPCAFCGERCFSNQTVYDFHLPSSLNTMCRTCRLKLNGKRCTTCDRDRHVWYDDDKRSSEQDIWLRLTQCYGCLSAQERIKNSIVP